MILHLSSLVFWNHKSVWVLLYLSIQLSYSDLKSIYKVQIKLFIPVEFHMKKANIVRRFNMGYVYICSSSYESTRDTSHKCFSYPPGYLMLFATYTTEYGFFKSPKLKKKVTNFIISLLHFSMHPDNQVNFTQLC